MPSFCHIKIINKLGNEISPECSIKKSFIDSDRDDIPLIETKSEKTVNDVENVVVCFAESRKGDDLSFLFDFRTVDVETGENVYWEKTIVFKGNFSPGIVREASNEKVYFGNNRNYWQIYFTHDGDNYKIDANNAMFNLSKLRDNGKLVKIKIWRLKNEIWVQFIAPSGKKWFKTIKGNRIERGILLKVKNWLQEDISDIRVLHAESTKNKIQLDTGENVVWKEFVKFSDIKVKGKTISTEHEIVSTKRIEFHYCKNYWQVFFTYDGHCYKLDEDNVNFNLSYEDNGQTMTITVLQKDNAINANFEIRSRKKSVAT